MILGVASGNAFTHTVCTITTSTPTAPFSNTNSPQPLTATLHFFSLTLTTLGT
jgi:hypothetical protein